MSDTAWAAYRNGKAIPSSLTANRMDLDFEAAGDWVGCDIRPFDRLTVRILSAGEYHPDGKFYPVIDGRSWGEKGRGFWKSEEAAMDVGIRCARKLLEQEQAK